jgi:hypothetical protein
MAFSFNHMQYNNTWRLSWSWSYDSWIYNYLCNQCLSPPKMWFRIPLRRGVLNTTLCDKVCHWLAAGRWFSPGTHISSTNKTEHHNITEILLKVVNTITLSLNLMVTISHLYTAGNQHKQNSWFCKEICEDNFRFWWRRVHEDTSQGMYMSKIEIFYFTARILQNQRMLCCGECFHD